MKLQGKIAIVTGADSGIGQATAEALAREGADVCITWHTDQDGAAETRRRVEATGRRAHVAQVDVGDPAGVRELFRASAAALGRKRSVASSPSSTPSFWRHAVASALPNGSSIS